MAVRRRRTPARQGLVAAAGEGGGRKDLVF